MSLRMQRRVTAWLAAGALVLKAAVPLLAATAAQLQGVGVAQVCSLYGVATVQSSHVEHHLHHHSGHHHAAGDAGDGGGSHPVADHGRDHCALTAVVAMAAGHAAVPSSLPRVAIASPPRHSCDSTVPDECALWVARLAHAPPTRS